MQNYLQSYNNNLPIIAQNAHNTWEYSLINFLRLFLALFQTLYTYPENFRAYKALIAAQYSGAKVKVADDFKFGESNKSAEFLKKFPIGKVRMRVKNMVI